MVNTPALGGATRYILAPHVAAVVGAMRILQAALRDARDAGAVTAATADGADAALEKVVRELEPKTTPPGG